jgi:hypothetical protein
MGLDMILNELSFGMVAEDVRSARERMTGLVETIRMCVQCGTSRALRTKPDINEVELAAGYNIARWRNDDLVDRDLRRYFGSLTAKAPLLAADLNMEQLRALAVSEIRIDGEVAEGLGFAWLMGTLAVSIRSDVRWDADLLAIRVIALNDDGEIEEHDSIVHHASQPNHANRHAPWISDNKRSSITGGEDLWRRRDDLFPHLAFAPDTETQICPLHINEPIFRNVVNMLFDLESYFATWAAGPFRADRIGRRITPESDATLLQYRQERTFMCPDGVSIVFSWHGRLTPGEWRLYIHPETRSRRCVVGYIGPHLPTVRFN